MKENAYLTLTLLLIFMNFSMTFCWALESMKVRNKQNSLENQINYLQYQLQNESDKYQREIDTCLDIIENKRWE